MFGAIAGAGAAVGLLLGGALTEYLSWRWTLYVNLFFAWLALAAAAVLLTREPTRGGQRLDVPGATYFSSRDIIGLGELLLPHDRLHDDQVVVHPEPAQREHRHRGLKRDDGRSRAPAAR